jgi:hypothetical protein
MRAVVVGSRCVYAYDCLPNMRRQTDFLTYHTSTPHPTKNFVSFFGFLASQQHVPCWPWRTDQRRHPRDIRLLGSG